MVLHDNNEKSWTDKTVFQNCHTCVRHIIFPFALLKSFSGQLTNSYVFLFFFFLNDFPLKDLPSFTASCAGAGFATVVYIIPCLMNLA